MPFEGRRADSDWQFKGTVLPWQGGHAGRSGRQPCHIVVRKSGQIIELQVPPSVVYFQLGPTSQRFYNLPKECHLLDSKCWNSWAYTGHFVLKLQWMNPIFSYYFSGPGYETQGFFTHSRWALCHGRISQPIGVNLHLFTGNSVVTIVRVHLWSGSLETLCNGEIEFNVPKKPE